MAVSNIDEWIPEIWSREFLLALRPKLRAVNLVNRRYDNEVASRGDVVNIPLPPTTLVAQDKVRGTASTPIAVTATKKGIELKHYKRVPFEIDNIQKMQTGMGDIRGFARAAATAVAKSAEQEVFNLYVDAGETVGTANTDITLDTIQDAREKLSDNEAPDDFGERHMFHSVKQTGNLLTALATSEASSMYNESTELRRGQLRPIYGFENHETQRTVAVAGSPPENHSLAFHRDGIVFLTRPLTGIEDGLGTRSQVVTDEDLNITMRMLMTFDALMGSYVIIYEMLFGVEVSYAPFVVDVVT